MSPLRRQNPREEPGALAAHAGICAGGGQQWPSLPRPSPSALANVAVLHKTRGKALDKLTVGAVLEAPEQPAPAQVLFCIHHPGLRC